MKKGNKIHRRYDYEKKEEIFVTRRGKNPYAIANSSQGADQQKPTMSIRGVGYLSTYITVYIVTKFRKKESDEKEYLDGIYIKRDNTGESHHCGSEGIERCGTIENCGPSTAPAFHQHLPQSPNWIITNML